MNRIEDWLKSYRNANYITYTFLIFILFLSLISIIILPVDAASIAKIHNNISGNITDPECSNCHNSQEKQHQQGLNQPVGSNPEETASVINIGYFAQDGNNYTAVLTAGQTP